MSKIVLTKETTEIDDVSLLDAVSLGIQLLFHLLDKVEDPKDRRILKEGIVKIIEHKELVSSGMTAKDIREVIK